MSGEALLEITNLCVGFLRSGKWIDVVRNVDIKVNSSETYGLIGESGCGKSTLGTAILQYLPRNGRITSGSISYCGTDLVDLDDNQLTDYRGCRIAMVYQNPFGALNPSLDIIDQLIECTYKDQYETLHERKQVCYEWLRKLHMPDPVQVGALYPHNLSGGMLQRIVIAMAMLSGASLLVLDEPTTALDTTVQAETLEILLELKNQRSITMLIISHDLGALAQICDRIGVMYSGELVEEAEINQIVKTPKHPYTAALLQCIPSAKSRGASLASIPGYLPSPDTLPSGCIYEPRCPIREEQCKRIHPELININYQQRTRCHFPERVERVENQSEASSNSVLNLGEQNKGALLKTQSISLSFGNTQILNNISFSISHGETMALVGESGSGKSTLARALSGLILPNHGKLFFANEELPLSLGQRNRDQMRLIQMVFQSPDNTLNPSRRVKSILERSISLLSPRNNQSSIPTVKSLLESVSLPESVARNTSRRLSGGQRQRVAIARAFSGQPKLVILDEPTSALDVSAQASIINLLTSLQQETECSYLFITHDLSVVRYLAHRITVLYLGIVVEIGNVEELFHSPIHPYTESLVSAIPSVSENVVKKRSKLLGENPGPRHRPDGCPFNTRCPYAFERCAEEFPPLQEHTTTHQYLCWIEPSQLKEMQENRVSSNNLPYDK